jgi:transposase
VDTFDEAIEESAMENRSQKNQKPKRARRRFTPEYKAGVVRLVLSEHKTKAEVARDLDLTPSCVERWVSQARADAGLGPPGVLTTAEKEELAQLRREVRQLRMEREILKKAAAFFAKENA